jgi:rifampicin phosphotransferase
MTGRSVTTSPPPGFWRRADDHYPRPLSPFGRSLLLPAANDGFRAMCEGFGLLAETVEEREIGGWVYLRVVPLGGRDRRPPPPWALPWLIRLSPRIRSRLRDCTEAARGNRAGRSIERWHTEWRPYLERRLVGLGETDLLGLSDAGLAGHLASLRALVHESQRIHMVLNHSVNQLLAEFVFAASDLVGWSDDAALRSLTGLSDMSTAPARALARLAEEARRTPAVRTHLELNAPVDAILAANADFADSFAHFQRWFGMRTIGYDAADPTLAERPELVLSQVRDQVLDREGGVDVGIPAAADHRQIGSARRSLERRPEDRARFERALHRARLAYPIREEHGFLDTVMPLALARYAALEAGRRLAERGQLADPEDVFFLEVEEVEAALASSARQHAGVGARRRERAEALAHPAPPTYAEEPPPLDLAALPAEAGAVHRAVKWWYDRVFAPESATRLKAEDGVLPGIAASPGCLTGPARVVLGESDFPRIQRGDVLVCPTASPVWSILFPRIGALVTDTGGALSHCAIIAREFGIPAVVATGTATRCVGDGDVVTVNGTAGTVTLHASEERRAECHASSSSTR